VGAGNVLRADDGAGPALIRELVDRCSAVERVRLIDAGSAPENSIGQVISFQPDTVCVVDAYADGAEPGRIRLLDPETLVESYLSTHGIPFAMLLDTIAQETGARVILIGITIANAGMAEGLSAPVRAAVAALASLFTERLCTNQP